METKNSENRNFMPRIGDVAPSFTAMTTQGEINFPSDYKGKWKILFSHPADFTPVCTSEFMTFASMAEEFEALKEYLAKLKKMENKLEIIKSSKINQLNYLAAKAGL